ncbi:uncharacterized protein jus isoform X1 [Panulirus ornatus]
MKPPTSVFARILLLLLAGMIAQCVSGASGHHTSHKKGHHGGGGGGHQHHHQSHHEPRAARTRREQEEPVDTAGSGDDVQGSESPRDIEIPCTGTGPDECAAIVNSECNRNICECPVSHPILDIDHSYCVKEAKLNTKCNFSSECEAADEYSYCSQTSVCVCRDNYYMEELPDIGFNCITETDGPGAVDPAMIGVLAGLALMFVIICVVLRLFSKARFRENRSIFNTPNPRLMNASLFKDSKLLSPARGDRRGSRASVRVPSRAPSVTSVNAASRSPNGSLAKADITGGRRGSALSAASATGSAAAVPGGQAASKTPSPSKDPKTPKPETTVAIETVD